MNTPTQHAWDCTIYRGLCNGTPTDGICTCGYGWSLVRQGEGDESQLYSKERRASLARGAGSGVQGHAEPTVPFARYKAALDIAEMLWTVVANVNDWTKESVQWREAAVRWRDAFFAEARAHTEDSRSVPTLRTSTHMSRASTSVIANDPPSDGRSWDVQCARCGSSIYFEVCGACDGEGITGPGELHEEDPLWYDPDDFEPCRQCGGEASWGICMSAPDWCEAHPLDGRNAIKRGQLEWFTFDTLPAPAPAPASLGAPPRSEPPPT